MAGVYVLETISGTETKFGDSAPSDVHGGWTVPYTLQHPPSGQHPSFLIIQTNEVVDARDNPVMIVRNPSAGAAWVRVGRLTPGATTHMLEIRAPAVLTQSFQVNLQTRPVWGSAGGSSSDPGLDDFGVTAIQVLYRPK
jgi:hypothetical protein